MLTDNISNCIAAVQTKRKVQENRASLNTQQAALAQLNLVCKQLKVLLECVAAIQNSEISSSPVLSGAMASDLSDSVAACGNAVKDCSLSKDTVAVLASTIKAASNETAALWRQVSTNYAEGPKGYLSLIGGLTSDPKGARTLSARITETCDGAPTVHSVKTLLSDVYKANEIISLFSLKPEIEVFLKKVSVQRATVFDLTPEVLAWLQEHGLTRKLKVNF